MTIRVHNFFRTGPFSKSATPEVKSFASSSAVHRIAVAAKWIFRLRESFIPRTDPNRTRKAERKNGIPVYKDGGREEDLAARGVVTGLNGGCKGSLGWKNSSFLPPLLRERDATAQDPTQNLTFISANQQLKRVPSRALAFIGQSEPQQLKSESETMTRSLLACALKSGNAN